jgi:hypothetical protein
VAEPTDQELLDLWNWMSDEWITNHDYDLPPEIYGRAVLAKFAPSLSFPKGQ